MTKKTLSQIAHSVQPRTLGIQLILVGLCLVAAPHPSAAQNEASARKALAKLSQLDTLAERREFYQTLDGKTKAKVWTLHFAAFEVDNKLDGEQAAFIDGLKRLLKDVDLDKQGKEIGPQLTGQMEQAIALFGRLKANELLVQLGGLTVKR